MAFTNIPDVPLYTGSAPNRNTQQQAEFSTNSDDSLQYQTTLADNINTTAAAMSTVANEVQVVADDAQDSADSATDSAAASASNANFKGKWVDQSGAANVPYSVSHAGDNWQLLSNIADVTASEPSTANADWIVIIGQLVIIARSLNVLDSEVIYSNDTDTVLDNVLFIYNPATQEIWHKPTDVVIGELINTVVNDQLTTDTPTVYTMTAVYSLGSTVTLAEAKANTAAKLGDVITISDRAYSTWEYIAAGAANIYDTIDNDAGTLRLELKVNSIPNVLEYGFIPNSSPDAAANAAVLVYMLSMTDHQVIRVPFVNAPMYVTNSIPVLNGRRIIFDSEYMGEPLFADPDRGIIGDGLGAVFITDVYPGGSNTHRQIRIDNARIRNTNFPCLELQDSDDAKLNECHMITTESEALKARFSARISVKGGNYISSFSAPSDDNFAMTFYDNCNGLYIDPTTIVSGGANGGTVDVSKCQKVNIDGIFESARAGIRIAGYSGNNLDAWVTLTNYTVGDYVQNTLTDNAYVANTTHTSGATFAGDSANWQLVNGNCNGVEVGGYLEAIERPFSFGASNIVLGLNVKSRYLGNTNATAPLYVYLMGAVVGWNIQEGSIHKKGTEPTILFNKPTVGSSVTDFAIGGEYSANHQQNGGPNFTLDAALTTADTATLFAENRLEFDQGLMSGVQKEWISPLFTANVPVAPSLLLNAGNGGRVDSIQVIDKTGTITCTVFAGSSAVTTELLTVDPETLSFTLNAANATVGASGLIRPSDDVRYGLTAGVGTGTFRLKFIYRN